MINKNILLIIIGMSLLLVGCGGGGGGSSQVQENNLEVPAIEPDGTPNPFQFSGIKDAPRFTLIESAPTTITGINIPTSISIENGEYSVDGGAFTSEPGTVAPNQALALRVMSSLKYSGVTRARVNVGSILVDFEVITTLPNFFPTEMAFDNQNIVYILDSRNSHIYRWSISDSKFLDSIYVGSSRMLPYSLVYSNEQKRLYLNYSKILEFGDRSIEIQYIDITAPEPVETPFLSMAKSNLFAAIGNFVLIGDSIYDQSGKVVDSPKAAQIANFYDASAYTWDDKSERLYFFLNRNLLHFEGVDPITGKFTVSADNPSSWKYFEPNQFVRASIDGRYVLLSSGNYYNQTDLTWAGALGGAVTDARWFADGSLVTLTTSNGRPVLKHLDANLQTTLEQFTIDGDALLRIFGTDQKMVVVTYKNGNVQMVTYVPNNDSDGDGVSNTLDAFPLDPAASIDIDRDGYPDAWNAGKNQNDSTTGLKLDAYPQDTACYLPADGNGTTCNYSTHIPNYVPDQVISDGGTVYLLSSANLRVYRWSIANESYINPYVVGINQGYGTLAPSRIAYSSDHKRLYLGYNSGAIQYIDLTAASPVETPFTHTVKSVDGLAAAGNFILAQDDLGNWVTHHLLNRDGQITDQKEWSYYSKEYAWDATTSRIYFFRDGAYPNDLHYEVIDQVTGKFTSQGETPYHGEYKILPPIRVSPAGQYVLLGSGNIYNQTNLTWAGALASEIADAHWFKDNTLVTLTKANNQTILRRLDSTHKITLEQRTYDGNALRIFGSDEKMVVVTSNNGEIRFFTYIPNDDGDGDGVPNTQDAFPLDPAASIDSDHDGYPDAWNPGKNQSDSTTGLSLDAFPQDIACYLPTDGIGGICNYDIPPPAYTPDQVVNDGDTVYLLSYVNRRIYRWSIAAARYLIPYVVGINQNLSTLTPFRMSYSSAHKRLYLGYGSGAIQYIDTTAASALEIPFTATTRGMDRLVAVGNYLFAQDSNGIWTTHYVFDRNGYLTATLDRSYYSREYAWDAVTSRVYFFRDLQSPNDLHYEVIDQATGAISSAGESPYHGNYKIVPPIRVSVDGQHVLLGSGDFYNQSGLTWAGTLGTAITDAHWLSDGSLVTLTTANNQTTLKRLSSNRLATLEQLTFDGQALRVIGTDQKMVVLTINNGNLQFYPYVPNDDSDGDGVPYTQDVFPLDPAASMDTDHDGYPDAWNPGKNQSDSTTGLTLDAYPQDAACYLPTDGIGGTCNHGSHIPAYTPDQVINDGDTVYLLSNANRRVFRWSIATASYLNPYVVGFDQGFATAGPSRMAYSSAHKRLYLSYHSGSIKYIDITAGSNEEVPFAITGAGISDLAAVGNYVLGGHNIYDRNGTVTTPYRGAFYSTGNHSSRDFAWDAVTSRLYYFYDRLGTNFLSSPYLFYEVIDQTTGLVTESGWTQSLGTYNIVPPTRVSTDGQYVILGSGDLYNQSGLTWAGSLGTAIADARWLNDGSLVTLTTTNNQTTLKHLSNNHLATLKQLTFDGQALRVVGTDQKMVVLAIKNGNLQFYPYIPNDDIDGDGVPNNKDAFPLDPAVSVDTDHDGYPDAWNPGKYQSDSTTGLTLDAYPQDAACYLPTDGDGVTCNYSAHIPAYTPDQVINDGDTVYLLSNANRRIYRWSIATASYLNPYVLGINPVLSTLAPSHIAYSSAHKRLYLSYSSGAIHYIDTAAGSDVEVPFAMTGMGISALAAVGNYVLGGHNIYDRNGTVTARDGANYYVSSYSSRVYAWDPVTSRLYFFRDGISPNDLLYQDIDQSTGKVIGSGETPYHGTYNIDPPIRVSADGQYVLLGSGNFYNQSGLTWSGFLGKPVKDADWNGDILITLDYNDLVELWDKNGINVSMSYQYLGQPVRLVFGPSGVYLLHIVNNSLSFQKIGV